MTEYWVSTGNKWCEYCRIFITNNAVSLRTHELGERHKNNVAKHLSKVQRESAMQEKDKLRAAKELEHIEAKAVKSYQNDVKATYSAVTGPTLTSSKIRESKSDQHTYAAKSTLVQRAEAGQAKGEWLDDATTGYQYNPTTGHYYDPKSGFYYSDVLGQWTTEEQALRAARASSGKTSGPPPPTRKPPPPPAAATATSTGASISKQVPLATRGRPSSFDVASHKRKREDKGPHRKRINAEEAAALAAREAARKRVQEREKSLMGLYQAY